MPYCKTCQYAKQITVGKCVSYVECTNETELAVISKKRNGTKVREKCANACKYYEEEGAEMARLRKEMALLEDLQELRGKIQYNTYKSIKGQINAGDLKGASIGIANCKRRIERQEARDYGKSKI